MTVALNPVYQTPLLTEYTPALKPPRRMDPLYRVIRELQDYDLDGVGAFGSASEPRRLRDAADTTHDTYLEQLRDWAILHRRPDVLALVEGAIRADAEKDRQIARIDHLFAENTEADRQSIAVIERLMPSPRTPQRTVTPSRQRAGRARP